jgi:diguanylate cyclase (GGDEF)-like protein
MHLRSSGGRLAAVVILLLIPILLLGYQFVRQSQKDIGFANRELDGLRYIQATFEIVSKLAGDKKIDNKENFRKLATELDGQMSSSVESADLLQKLEVQNDTTQHLISSANNLIAKVGDQSNLILDPDLDTYYLMDVTLLRLPEIDALSREVTESFRKIGSSFALTPSETSHLQLLAGQISAMQKGLKHSFSSAFNGSRDGSVRKALEAISADYNNQIDSYLYSVQEEISNRTSSSLSTSKQKSISEHQFGLNQATHELWNKTALELKRLLEKRVSGLKTIRDFSLGLSVLIALVAMGIAIGVFRAMLHRLDDRIIHLAHHDGLTGLPNRTSFMEQAKQRLEITKNLQSNFAILFVDMDRFKSLNDLHGHGAGDTVIKLVAERINSVVAPRGLVSRLGGDEFVVAVDGFTERVGLKVIADRILAQLSKPYELGSRSYQGSASIGVSSAPAQGYELTELLKTADMALYCAKDNGRNQVLQFTEDMRTAVTNRTLVEHQIRDALSNNSFTLVYQPLYGERGKKLSGFEALLRLHDINGKPISPAVLIPVAEQSRLIVEIGRWVVKEACKAAVHWPDELTVAINISPIELEEGSVANTIASALEESGLPAHRLEIEITETALLDPTPQVLDQLNRIHLMGVAIAIDDFGAGYSSFGYLWRLPFSKLKIDRSLTSALGAPDSAVNIVFQSIVTMCRGLNIKVTAEGVENLEQQNTISDFGCEELQGFLLGRPMPSGDLAAYILKEWSSMNSPKLLRIEEIKKLA